MAALCKKISVASNYEGQVEEKIKQDAEKMLQAFVDQCSQTYMRTVKATVKIEVS